MLALASMRGGARRGDKGFALLGLVIVMTGLLTAVFVVTALAFLGVTVSKEEQTQEKLARLVEAIAGTPKGQPGATQGTHGFSGDVGRLPKSLDELNSLAGPHTLCDAALDPAAPPAFHTADSGTSHRGRVGMGWRGPYFKEMLFTDEHVRDAWGVRLRYTCPETTRTEAGVSLTVRTGQITSAGKDGLFDTADDIETEAFHDRGHVFLTVTQGGADKVARNVTATLYFASNGEQASLVSAPAEVAGPEGSETTIVFPSIPAGVRFVQIDFGGPKKELYYTFVKSNIANRINVKIPVGGGGKG